MVEGIRSSLPQALKQCLLAMRDSNGEGKVYGFATTGEPWRMYSYDGVFLMTNKIDVPFNTMDKGYSVLVDCIYAAMSNREKRLKVSTLFPGDLFIITNLLIRESCYLP